MKESAPVRPRRSRARRGEGERLKDDILDAAEGLLLRTGDEDAVSIRAVAEAVGVTPPSIYMHFRDKTELVFEVCRRNFEEFDRHMEEAAARFEDPLESLMARGRAYIEYGLERPEQYRILFMIRPSKTPEEFDPAEIQDMVAFDHLVGAVDRCKAAGQLPDEDSVMISIGLWVVVHGIVSLFIAKSDFPWPDREALIQEIMSNYVEGLRRRIR